MNLKELVMGATVAATSSLSMAYSADAHQVVYVPVQVPAQVIVEKHDWYPGKAAVKSVEGVAKGVHEVRKGHLYRALDRVESREHPKVRYVPYPATIMPQQQIMPAPAPNPAYR
ncbi:Uncharacterised protein [uncultured archaeon]|nr:Uncharacterised protein [uncultured archaeon]